MISQFPDFKQRECFPRLLGQFGFGGRKWPRHQGIDFVCVKPNEVTNPANVDFDQGFVGESYFDHGMPAGWARAAALSFAADGMKPERIDRLRRESSAQEFETDGAAVTTITSPKHAVPGANLFQG